MTADGPEAHMLCDDSGQKAVRINGTPLERVSAIVGEYRVLLSPDHGGIIGAGPAERRKFLDIVLCQTSARYLSDLQEYRRILRQRNRLLLDGRLRGGVPAGTLEPWTAGLVQYGSRIVEKRLQCVEAMRAGFAASYAEIAGVEEPVSLDYVTMRGVTQGCGGSVSLEEQLGPPHHGSAKGRRWWDHIATI
jgi:DNA replication and repair protein RecF